MWQGRKLEEGELKKLKYNRMADKPDTLEEQSSKRPKDGTITCRFTHDELDEMDEQSFRNMVWFYAEELKRILAGESILDVLNARERRGLRKIGVIELSSLLELTEKAKKALEELESEE